MWGMAPSTSLRLSDEERIDWLRLIRAENVGPRTFRTLIQHYGSARSAPRALPDLASRGRAKPPARIPPREEAEHLTRVLRLGVAETIVHTWLPQLIKRVNHAYPNLSLEIEVDITSNLRSRLLAQEIELAFLLGPLTAPTVNNRVLCDYPVGFLASPSLGLGKRDLTVHDLAKFPIITFPRKTQPYEIVRSLFNRPDLPPMRLHASASLATVIHMAIEGLGIAVIPTAI